MGKPPAAIFIARHGARLDAANKDWHLTSATPYDPPLSYGGWLQSRALGTRIVKELRSLEEQHLDRARETKGTKLHSHRPQERRSKRKIIIHTSPFLRCVQTAVAISSGISQNYADTDTLHPKRAPPSDLSNSAMAPPELNSSPDSDPQNDQRCLLRVDACLGEWLNPGYFENIIPPPKSERMIATAKMELLRRDTGIIPAADTQNKPSVGHFPGGWGNIVSVFEGEEDRSTEPDSASGIIRRASQRNRAGSYDSLRAVDTPLGRKMLRINTDLPPIPDAAYTPPIPSYAIASSCPIPDGYVTHARDACVLVDYQWDSMREPQNWGNGGEYGEEWSTMHTRFRNGLERMIQWYQNDNASTTPSHRRTRSQLQFLEQDEGDDLSNTILIIVTHGAGCNALIGGLMGGPAFVDVNTASLTLAIRRDCVKEPVHDADTSKLPKLLSNPSGFEDYRLVEVASTDHLRPGTSPTTSHRSPSISSLPSPSAPSYRQRLPSRASFSSGPVLLGPSLKPGLQSWNMPRASSGLWNSVSGDEEAVEDLVPNFGTPLSTSSSIPNNDMATSTLTSKTGGSTWSGQLPQRTLSQRGLWGSAPLNKERQVTSNRRWTVAERPL